MNNNELIATLNEKQGLLNIYNAELNKMVRNNLNGTAAMRQSIKDKTKEIDDLIEQIKGNNSKDIQSLEDLKIIDIPASITTRKGVETTTTGITLLAQVSRSNRNVVNLSNGDMTISITREYLDKLSGEFEF